LKQVLLTISIVAVGDQPHALDCLESIEAQTSAEHEVHLVTNSCSQAFLDELASRHPQVRLINHPTLRSFAANHNEVMRQCDSECLLLLNDDTVILDRALDRMLDFLKSQSSEVGIVGCTNLTGSGEFALSCYPFPNASVIISQHAMLGRVLTGRGYQRYMKQARGAESFPVDWVQGSCILIRREVIEAIGHLDEDFFLFSEEVDYCYRARCAGFVVYQVPRARIVHYDSTTTHRFVPLKLRGHYLGKMYFLAKHGFIRDLRLVRAWFIAELLVKSAIRGAGVLVGHPSDAKERLQAYLDLIGICATYRGQPAVQLLSGET
jgi:GT2 family glycosyltransferase